jgi:hypothetical protein
MDCDGLAVCEGDGDCDWLVVCDCDALPLCDGLADDDWLGDPDDVPVCDGALPDCDCV